MKAISKHTWRGPVVEESVFLSPHISWSHDDSIREMCPYCLLSLSLQIICKQSFKQGLINPITFFLNMHSYSLIHKLKIPLWRDIETGYWEVLALHLQRHLMQTHEWASLLPAQHRFWLSSQLQSRLHLCSWNFCKCNVNLFSYIIENCPIYGNATETRLLTNQYQSDAPP